jgi:hypothetical protein
MKSTDRILVGIVVGIVILVVVALVAVLVGPEPEYQPDNSPENVAHNYLLALQNMEYERAYSYLSPYLNGYPFTLDKFNKNIEEYSRYFRSGGSVTLSVEKAVVIGKTAIVTISESRFQGGDLFNSSKRTSVFEMKLRLEGDSWKVAYAPSYFVPCWAQAGGCK